MNFFPSIPQCTNKSWRAYNFFDTYYELLFIKSVYINTYKVHRILHRHPIQTIIYGNFRLRQRLKEVPLLQLKEQPHVQQQRLQDGHLVQRQLQQQPVVHGQQNHPFIIQAIHRMVVAEVILAIVTAIAMIFLVAVHHFHEQQQNVHQAQEVASFPVYLVSCPVTLVNYFKMH